MTLYYIFSKIHFVHTYRLHTRLKRSTKRSEMIHVLKCLKWVCSISLIKFEGT